MRSSRTSNFLCAAVAAASLSVGIARGAAIQTPLDPNAFTSIGTINALGAYAFDTGNGASTPTLTANTNNGNFTLDGVISNGLAVFDFESIDLPSGSSVTGVGTLPLALLSRSSVTTGNVSIDVSSVSQQGIQGAGAATAGNGPGAGSLGGGGSFGGTGGANALGHAGPTYGDPLHVFMGGSGGGGLDDASSGGAGGGALEISAEAGITLNGGSVQANGGDGGLDSSGNGGGGGSGGGIFLASPGEILINGAALIAQGGDGASSSSDFGGSGGGGGRILLDADSVVYVGGDPTILVDGGAGAGGVLGEFNGGAGAPGTFAVADYVVPEPASLSLLGLGAAGSLLKRRRKA